MKKKTQAVLNGYLNLSLKQRDKFIKEIQKEREKVQKGIMESPTVSLGPIRGGCPCCGR
jgi:hypothetical protein